MRRTPTVLLFFFCLSLFSCVQRKDYALEEVLKNAVYLKTDQEATLNLVKHATSWKSSAGLKTNRGLDGNVYWVRFNVANQSDAPKMYHLEFTGKLTDSISIYSLTGEEDLINHSLTGEQVERSDPKATKTLNNFRFILTENESRLFYMRFYGGIGSLNIRTVLYHEAQFDDYRQDIKVLQGAFYGMFLLTIVLYTLFAFLLKRSVFLYFVMFIVSLFINQLAIDGLFYHWFSEEFTKPDWSNNVINCWTMLSFLLFFSRFTRIHIHGERLNKAFRLLIYAVLGIGLFSFIAGKYNHYIFFTFAITIPFAVILCGYTFYNVIRREGKIDYYFVAGVSIFLPGVVIYSLNMYGLVPQTFFTEHILIFSGLIMLLLLSFSLILQYRVSEHKRNYYTQLALSRSREANRMKSFFMSNISHELRTPLNSIIGFTDYLLQEKLPELALRNLKLIKYSGTTLLGLVNDILDFARMDEGNLKLTMNEFDLKEVVNLHINTLKVQARDKQLELDAVIDGELPNYVLGDQYRLNQILLNVSGNAFKFTEKGQVSFHCWAVDNGPGEITLHIEVSDTGIGIAREKLDSIFESFKQISFDTHRKYGGSGLGSSITKKLIELHRGSIELTSDEGKGTTVHIAIPYQRAEEHEVLPSATIPEAERSLEGLKVLLVEDNIVNQMVAKQVLDKWNASVHVCNNGKEAISAASSAKFDVILMDLQMPEMDGYEATEVIRDPHSTVLQHSIPIIALTADVMESTRKRVQKLGMNDYITKPFDQNELFIKLHVFINTNTREE